MFVELVYDKRNVEGLANARELFQGELEKRIHRIFPHAEVRVKPMQTNAINSDGSKSEKEKISAIVTEMFEEADMWMTSEAE